MNDALISIRPEYVDRILSGAKSIEIRSRTVGLLPGTRLWIYSTLPRGRIEAVVRVNLIEVGPPTSIWDRYRNEIGVSRSTFRSYVNGSTRISAILLAQPQRLEPSLSLQSIRSQLPSFRPPQFLKRLGPSDRLLQILLESLYRSDAAGA